MSFLQKNKLIFLSIILLIIILPSEVFATGISKSKKSKIPDISDMVLIYHGGTQRPVWNTDQLRSYLYRQNSGNLEWLFDGFLFLEIFDNIQNYEYDHYDTAFGYRTAGKKQWYGLLNRYFGEQKGPDALEILLDSLSKKGKSPIRKRQVVLSIPFPVYKFTEWGELNGKKLNFNNTDDQVKAVCWFIDEALKIWNKKNYKHIQLNGFYWVHEDLKQSNAAIPIVKKYLKTKNLNFLWIPYWGAKRKGEGKRLGFDFAWLQPNYFFATDIPKKRLNDVCIFAKKHHMGLEMEFDERVAKPEFRSRFYDYLRIFKENNVWDSFPVAYYEGGGEWMQMANSKDPELKKMFDTLGNIIVKRQTNADKCRQK